MQKFTSLYVKQTENERFLKSFGKHLSEMRRKKNISQEQLSFDADISLSSISKIERGILNISISNAYKIAKALNIHSSDLFKFEVLEKEKK